ncbi:hypothetical protein PoB_006403200, partial [Plakobranchus ocellatus]
QRWGILTAYFKKFTVSLFVSPRPPLCLSDSELRMREPVACAETEVRSRPQPQFPQYIDTETLFTSLYVALEISGGMS